MRQRPSGGRHLKNRVGAADWISMPSRWSRDDLVALVSGARITLLDTKSGSLPVPEWLAEAADGVMPGAKGLDIYRRVDRERIMMTYIKALENPGELLETSGIAYVNDRPFQVAATAINLCDHPDVGGVLFCSRGRQISPEEVPRTNTRTRDGATDWMLLTLDEHAVIHTIEGRAEDILGYRNDELLGTRPVDHLPPEDQPATISLWLELLEEPDRLLSIQGPWNRKDGSQVWLESTYVLRSASPNGEGKALVAIWDVTPRIEAENQLRQREADLRRLTEDLRTLADEVPSAVFRCDGLGVVTFHNARWQRLLAERSDVARIHDLLDDDGRVELNEMLAAAGGSWVDGRREIEVQADDGQTWFRLGLRPVPSEESRHFIGSLEDVTATVQLRTKASHDTLTGILNREAIESRIEEVDRECDELDLVAFVDLDRFKDVNDTHGHHVGDLVLTEVAARLVASIREGDVAGRWGGDEFVLVCRGVTDEGARQLIDRLHDRISQPVVFDGGTLTPMVSVGLARPAGDGVEGLLRRADEQMFDEKRRRRRRSASRPH